MEEKGGYDKCKLCRLCLADAGLSYDGEGMGECGQSQAAWSGEAQTSAPDST